MKKITAALLFALTSAYTQAQSLPIDDSARLKAGINIGSSANAYNTDANISIWPHAFYDNNRLYIEGAELGVYAYKDKQHQARIGLSYDGRSFDPDDAHGALKQLDKRKDSVLAHASYMYVTPIGAFRTKIATDALGEHKGTTISLAHISRFQAGQATIYPSVGVTWYDDSYNNYYYGVSQSESSRSGIDEYQADSGITPFVSAMVDYKFNDDWSMFVNARNEWLSSKQKDSPLVDNSTNASIRAGLSYQF